MVDRIYSFFNGEFSGHFLFVNTDKLGQSQEEEEVLIEMELLWQSIFN